MFRCEIEQFCAALRDGFVKNVREPKRENVNFSRLETKRDSATKVAAFNAQINAPVAELLPGGRISSIDCT
jgi:hypothetical protein